MRQKQDNNIIDEIVCTSIVALLHTGASNRDIRHMLRKVYNITLPRNEITKVINKVKRGRLE